MKITGDKQIGRARAAALAYIDAMAENARGTFLTLAPGQALVYLLKLDAARAVAAGAASSVLLSAEIGVSGTSVPEIANTIIARHNANLEALAAIERLRLAGKAAARRAATPAAAQAAAAIVWPAPA